MEHNVNRVAVVQKRFVSANGGPYLSTINQIVRTQILDQRIQIMLMIYIKTHGWFLCVEPYG